MHVIVLNHDFSHTDLLTWPDSATLTTMASPTAPYFTLRMNTRGLSISATNILGLSTTSPEARSQVHNPHHLVQPPHLSFCGPLVRTSSNVRDWCQVPPPSQVNQNSPCLMTPTTISLSTYSAFSLDRHVMPSPCEQTSSTSWGQPPPSPWCERQQCSWSWARRTPRSLPPSIVTLFTSALHWETVCFIITSIELESIGRFALEKSLEENLPNHFEIWNI